MAGVNRHPQPLRDAEYCLPARQSLFAEGP